MAEPKYTAEFAAEYAAQWHAVIARHDRETYELYLAQVSELLRLAHRFGDRSTQVKMERAIIRLTSAFRRSHDPANLDEIRLHGAHRDVTMSVRADSHGGQR